MTSLCSIPSFCWTKSLCFVWTSDGRTDDDNVHVQQSSQTKSPAGQFDVIWRQRNTFSWSLTPSSVCYPGQLSTLDFNPPLERVGTAANFGLLQNKKALTLDPDYQAFDKCKKPKLSSLPVSKSENGSESAGASWSLSKIEFLISYRGGPVITAGGEGRGNIRP